MNAKNRRRDFWKANAVKLSNANMKQNEFLEISGTVADKNKKYNVSLMIDSDQRLAQCKLRL